MDRFFPSVILPAVDAIEFRGSRICRVRFGRLELLWYNVRLLPHNLVKLEMALEESNKVWLNRRVRVNPNRKFFPLKK